MSRASGERCSTAPVAKAAPRKSSGGTRLMLYQLPDKVVLITGPARGIGAETARRLAARGARLSLVGLEPERLAALATSLGDGHHWSACDVTDQAGLDAAVAATVEALGGIDVVIANAGVASHGTVAVTPVDALA